MGKRDDELLGFRALLALGGLPPALPREMEEGRSPRMACRVGVSKTLRARIEYWKAVEGHTHGEILAQGLTCDDATKA